MTCECPAHQWLGRECECLCDHNEDSPETKVMRVKRHFRENKERYIRAAIVIVVGGAAVAYNKKHPTVVVERVPEFVNNNVQNNILVEAPKRRMHPGLLVHDKDTRITYPSINAAADAFGVDRSQLSKHLRGLPSNVEGLDLEVLGEAAA